MKILSKKNIALLLLGSILFCSCGKDSIVWNLPRNNPNDSLGENINNNNSLSGEIIISRNSIEYWYSNSYYDFFSLNICIKNNYTVFAENIYYQISTTFVSTTNTDIGGSEYGNIGNINPNEEKLLFNSDSPYQMTLYIKLKKNTLMPINIPFFIEVTYEVNGIQYTKSFQITA